MYTHHHMKKLALALCAVVLVAGFFGMQAVSESSLPFWEAIGCLAGILLVMLGAAKVANKVVK